MLILRLILCADGQDGGSQEEVHGRARGHACSKEQWLHPTPAMIRQLFAGPAAGGVQREFIIPVDAGQHGCVDRSIPGIRILMYR